MYNEKLTQNKEKKERRQEYKKFFLVTIGFTLAILGFITIYIVDLHSQIRELKKQIKEKENIYENQKERINELETEITNKNNLLSSTKNNLAEKTVSESFLLEEEKRLKKENSELKSNLIQLKTETFAKIDSLQSENNELKRELGKDLQEEMKKDYEGITVIYSNKPKFNLICPKCPKNVPILRLFEKDHKIYVESKCEDCDYSETLEINAFLSKLKEVNKINVKHCEKQDGSHNNINATYYYQGKYYCNECAKDIKKLMDTSDLIEIEDGVIYTEEKYKYYCKECHKHFASDFNLHEHNSQHHIIELNSIEKEISIEKHEIKLDKMDSHVKNDLYNTKNVVFKVLPQIISEVNHRLGLYQNKIDALKFLGKILEYNYEKSKNYPNYPIIYNILEFNRIMSDSFKFKNLETYNENGINVVNIGQLFKLLEENVFQ